MSRLSQLEQCTQTDRCDWRHDDAEFAGGNECQHLPTLKSDKSDWHRRGCGRRNACKTNRRLVRQSYTMSCQTASPPSVDLSAFRCHSDTQPLKHKHVRALEN